MMRLLAKSAWLLLLTVAICCVGYTAVLWVIGQTFFPFQANGSMVTTRPGGEVVGSLLIAQPFTKDEYFWPRPSAASYDAGASSSSALAPSNPTLRGNVAGYVGPVVRYKTGDKAGQQVATTTFDDWQQAHPDVQLQEVPADMVTTSGSGLDPHITLANAEFQLPRVAGKWAANTHRPVADVQREIEQILKDKALAPWNGLAGEKLVNVLEVNIELRERYGPPQ